MDRVSQLILGILCPWTAEALLALWFICWRSGDDTWLWMQTSDVVGGLLGHEDAVDVLHITAPSSLDGKVRRRNRGR